MKDIKYLLKQVDEQITALQSKRTVLQQALEIQDQLENGKTNNLVYNIPQTRSSEFLDSEEIEKAILKINGEFKAKDVPKAAESMFPNTNCNPSTVASTLHQMIEAKKLKYVSERSGRKAAIYRKA